MASAYIKSKGAGFENDFQLYGWIQRYLEQYPDGGFFQGKNFVFDHRLHFFWEMLECYCRLLESNYSSRRRCIFCRMLVLIWNSCQDVNSTYACELCQKAGKDVRSVLEMKVHKSVEISEGGGDMLAYCCTIKW
ncbi:unnamed protein product [Cuscuta campestris]|uniref:Uncharacterized protein n=1 Tax=Cuscuta campestris TaxID=132261 RepID=A0A484M8I9_9ASTE|nr:unnamed protein product [Cuscuta campestris]